MMKMTSETSDIKRDKSLQSAEGISVVSQLLGNLALPSHQRHTRDVFSRSFVLDC